MPIILTEKAAGAVKKIIEENKLPAESKLRVGVKGGGCSGFSYMLDLVEEPAGEQDETLESNGVAIVVDSRSLLYLENTEIDFRDDSIMGSGFVFKNPNATSTCGCGSSFQA